VTISSLESGSLLDYQLRLPSFDGPLDVLLRLIERSQLQITDVSLVAVTDQFLAHIRLLGGGDPDAVAEFTNVGTRLVLLKSRSLLPRPPVADDDEAPSDLTRELIEYRIVKLAASELAERDRRGDGAFARSPAGIAPVSASSPPKLAMHQPLWLARAIRQRLTVVTSPSALVQIRPFVSLREMIERVLQSLSDRRCTNFGAIARQCRDAQEVRTAFLALLVLVRRREIEVEQQLPFGEISVTMRAGALALTGGELALLAMDAP
jgi:segregation and condensation protein A